MSPGLSVMGPQVARALGGAASTAEGVDRDTATSKASKPGPSLPNLKDDQSQTDWALFLKSCGSLIFMRFKPALKNDVCKR